MALMVSPGDKLLLSLLGTHYADKIKLHGNCSREWQTGRQLGRQAARGPDEGI